MYHSTQYKDFLSHEELGAFSAAPLGRETVVVPPTAEYGTESWWSRKPNREHR